MKKFKMLMMAILTIASVSVSGHTLNQYQTEARNRNQRTEKVSYSSLIYISIVIDRLSICQQAGTVLNLSLKEKMKMEVMKIYPVAIHDGVTSDKLSDFSKTVINLNLSPKEKMKMETVRMHNYPMIVFIRYDKQGRLIYCSAGLNLSLKEKMKMEVMKM